MKKMKKLLVGIVGLFVLSIGLFASNINSNDMLKAGYLNNTYGPWKNQKITVSEAASHGYNTLVLAFAELKGDAPMKFCGDQFLAYTSWDTFTSDPSAITNMVNDINKAKKEYGLKHVLVSVGGSTQSFSMGDPKNMASDVVDFLNKYNLDGIDFDLEQHVDPAKLDQLIKNIKTDRPGTIVTAAPQFYEITPGVVNFVTTGTDTDYTTAINNGDFNYLFVQLYNSDGYNINGFNEKDTEFITAAFNYMTEHNLAPATTKIITGEPASAAAGAAGTIYHNTKYTISQDAWNAVKDQADTLIGQPQFGGFFNWAVNYDADNGYGFSKTVYSDFNKAL